jgi:hypothetical protein
MHWYCLCKILTCQKISFDARTFEELLLRVYLVVLIGNKQKVLRYLVA